MNLKISIIIPIYNAEDTLKRTLDSIINQTYKNIEIILINDGSQDNSLGIIEEYRLKDPRIIVINQPNKGVSCARNAGLDIATGDYISFVDSDDYIDLNTYQLFIDKVNETNGDIIKCAYRTEYRNGIGDDWYFDLDTNIVYDKTFINEEVIKNLLGLSNIRLKNWLNGDRSNAYFFAWMTLYHKDIIVQNYIRFNEDLSIGEDLLFNLECFYYSNSFAIINEPLYHWVDNSQSSTRVKDIKLGEKKLRNLKERKKFCEKYNLGDSYKECYRNQIVMLGFYQIKYLASMNESFKYRYIELKKLFQSDLMNEGRSYLVLDEIPLKFKLFFLLFKLKGHLPMFIILNIIKNFKCNLL